MPTSDCERGLAWAVAHKKGPIIDLYFGYDLFPSMPPVLFLTLSGVAPSFSVQGGGTQHVLKRVDQEGLKEVVKQGLVYFEREERDLHMLLFPEILDQVIIEVITVYAGGKDVHLTFFTLLDCHVC